jgi:hypothetical protein
LCSAARSGTFALLCHRQAGSTLDTRHMPALFHAREACSVLFAWYVAERDRLLNMLRVIQEVADAIVQIYSRAAKFSQYVSTGLSGEYAVS